MPLLNTQRLMQEAVLSGVHLLLPFLIFLFIYLAWKLLVILLNWLIWKNQSSLEQIKVIIKFSIIFIIIISLTMTIIVITVNWVNNSADLTWLESNNLSLMKLDKTLFGTYLPFWLQSETNPLKPLFDYLTPTLITTYRLLSGVLSAVLLLTLVKNIRYFYGLLLTVVLSVIFSLPFWFSYPALTPREALWHNILLTPIPATIQTDLNNYQPNPILNNYLNHAKKIKNHDSRQLTITTIPSLHVAWVTAILYFGVQAWPLLAIVLVPYFILNFLATIFTLQHYAVDSWAGIIISILAIVLAKILIKKILPATMKRSISDLIANDLAFLKQQLQRLPNLFNNKESN
ncbi:MAG: phosphatase PAP2 family protein [Patescibacteria group bacterium]